MSTRLILCATMLLLLAHIGFYYPYTADDTFISLRYAERLTQGLGLTWNTGERVEGYSNPLWVALAAGLHLLGMDLLQAVQAMSVLSALGCMIVFYRYAAQRGLADHALATALIAFAASAPVAIWGSAGLETTLVMLCFAAAMSMAHELLERFDKRQAIITGLWLGLICLLRPEGPLYTAAICFSLYVHGKLEQRPRLIIAGIIAACSAAFFIGLLLFRLVYFGTWLPNTVLAKVAFTPVRLVTGFDYAARAWLSFSALCLMGYGARKTPACGFFQTPMLILSLAIAVAGGDWLPGYRAFAPLVPLVIFILMEATAILPLNRKTILLLSVALVLHGTIQFLNKDNINAKMGQHWTDETLQPIGLALKDRFGAEQPLIAVYTAGAIPYYSELPTLDVYGLNDATLTQRRHAQKQFGQGLVGHDLFDAGYIESRKPDILLFDIPRIVPLCETQGANCKNIFTHYTQSTLHTPHDDVTIWLRNDSKKVAHE